MKILYAIQATGNGHISRAVEIIPFLKSLHETDILVSGLHSEMEIPYEVKFRFRGLGFIFGKKGGIDLYQTYKKNKIRSLLFEINNLPVEDYDLVISDFEPVSAWACYQKGIPCVGLSNQVAVLNKLAPQPKKFDPIGKLVLKRYAPVHAAYGFHFKAYDDKMFTPVIRKQVREQSPKNLGHYTVYLPAYSDKKILKIVQQFPDINWEIFSKNSHSVYKEGNCTILPIKNDDFVKSMASAAGVLCAAGFATPTEALFLKKKLMVIPMKGQFEQQCNAKALKEMGVSVIRSLKSKNIEKIKNWLNSDEIIEVEYPDVTAQMINKILEDLPELKNKIDEKKQQSETLTIKKLRKMMLKKIAASFI